MSEIVKKNARRIVCGVAVGAANSLFGGGGGMLAVPLLQQTGLSQKEAHATAILVILPVSAFSFLIYVWKGLYSLRILIPTALGVFVGGLLGAQLLGKVNPKWVSPIFAVLQVFAGAWMLFF